MAGILGAPLGGGWRLPPPYETIADEQAAAMGSPVPAHGGQTRAGLSGVLTPQPQSPPQMSGGLADYLQMMAPEKKKRPIWKDILGSVLDGIASAGGGDGAYWSTIQKEGDEAQKVREKLAEMIYQRQAKQEDRAASLEDWKIKEQWQRDNPAPAPMVRDLEAWNSMTPQQQAEYARMMDVRNPVAVSGPTGTYRVPRGYGQQPSNGPQPGTVEDGHIFMGGDPADPKNWRPQ